MSRKEGMPPALPSDSQNFSSISNSLSSSITNLANSNLMQCGRRPFIIQDASQRMMLHKIRDSLAHLQKNSLPSPAGSDTSGASGTSTPNKEVAGKEATKRNDYNRDALAEIKKDLQKFKNDDNKDQEDESTLKVNVKEIIQQIYPNESINNKTAGPLHIQKIHDSVKVEQQNSHTEHETVSPPPLPPRTRGQSPPPPPLPTRDYPGNLTPTGLSRSSAQYQPVKRTKEAVVNNSNSRGVSPGPATSVSRPNSGIPSISSLAPNATPPSTLEQLAQQTGYTTEEIQKILLEHSAKQRQQQLYLTNPSNPFPNSSHNEQNIFAQTINDGRPVTQQHAYSSVVHAPLASPTNSNGNSILPPNYASAHSAVQSAPPPPYKTPHQTSPASSVTSGSSNDYLLYGHSFQPVSSEYKASAYGESLSSGSSSPASLHSHPSYNHFHPPNAGGAHMNVKPLPVPVWEAKPHPVVTQSARSQMVARPVLQTATAPPSHTQAPPSYTSVRHHVTSAAGAGIGGGNVHIKLRNHQDPQLQVTGFPNFQVTAQTSPHTALKARGSEFNTPSIQIQFSSGNPTIDAHGRRKGSLETRSDSPVSRATNQSPCSLISSTSTGSDLIPERPPPPYPGPSKLYCNGPMQTAQTTSHPPSAEISEVEQSETESENDHPATKHKCTSPIPKLRPEGDKKDEDRGWTKLRHYSPAAFKFYMEQHIENILKQHKERIKRKVQLESEMSKVDLSEEAKNQMRLMLNKKETIYLRLKRAKMDRSMFEVIAKLGIGAFGEVSLVRKCRSEADEQLGVQLYAMKTLRKVDVIRRNQVAHVKAERDILAEADLEWVVKLYYSFQDKENLYFIMEYIPGGDLMALLIKKGIFEEPLAVFYIAELVCAIDSVHKMGFIHRDIKPDNILIDRDGHIKLTDFGLCTGFRWTHNSKYYQEGSHLRQDSMDQDLDSDPCNCQSKELNKILERRRRKEKQRCLAHSLVGTPNYIAPEVLLREGYTKTCDWWSVGVILYEMLVGHPPFYANSPKETQLKVVNWKQYLHFPEDSKLSVPAHDLILKLCCDAFTRLGKNGAEEIKRHSLFKKIDFNELRRQKPPHKPVIRYPTDTSNFDEVEDQEPCPYQTDDLRLNGHYPEHAFSEFTFRRFFDDGHSRQLNIAESLSHGLQSLSLPPNGTHGISSQSNNIGTSSRSEEQTTQNSYHKDETRSTGGNPVYV